MDTENRRFGRSVQTYSLPLIGCVNMLFGPAASPWADETGFRIEEAKWDKEKIRLEVKGKGQNGEQIKQAQSRGQSLRHPHEFGKEVKTKP